MNFFNKTIPQSRIRSTAPFTQGSLFFNHFSHSKQCFHKSFIGFLETFLFFNFNPFCSISFHFLIE